jgi:hypothetical protein
MSRNRRPSRPLPAAVLALAVAGMTGCSGVSSQGSGTALPGAAPTPGAPTSDIAVRKTPVVPGRPARVFIFAGFGDNCEPLPEPELAITAAPAKGDVTFQPGQETTIKTSEKGTCIGQTAKGTGVYYTAHAGQTGTDRFSVAAKLSSGETAVRSFEVRIAE